MKRKSSGNNNYFFVFCFLFLRESGWFSLSFSFSLKDVAAVEVVDLFLLF